MSRMINKECPGKIRVYMCDNPNCCLIQVDCLACCSTMARILIFSMHLFKFFYSFQHPYKVDFIIFPFYILRQ